MHIYLFFTGMACSILISEANSKTNTYKANNMTLDVEKSEALERDGKYGLGRLQYVVKSKEHGFEIEFFTNKDNLSLERLNSGAIRVSYGTKDKPTRNTYLDISIKGRKIKGFDIIDYFLLGSNSGISSLLNIVVEPLQGENGKLP